MEKKSNYYNLLGVSKDAAPQEIRRAYHEAVLRLHPDVNMSPGDTELFLDIQGAYDVLSNPNLKANYDDSLSANEGYLPIDVQVLYSQLALPQFKETQLIYALMSFTPNDDQISNNPGPLNICLALDRSTSMKGPRLDNVKETTLHLYRQIKDRGSLSIVTFSDRAEVLLPAGAHREPWEVESSIHLIQSGGGTEIYQGLMAALAEVYRLLDTSAVNHIILLTDGMTYGDEEASLKLAETAARQGVSITCLGIGDDWNDVFLDKLASITGGSSFYASDPVEIGSILKDKISNINRVFASDVILDGKIGTGVDLNYQFRLQPEIGELPDNFPAHLGTIPNDGSLKVLLEFLIYPGHENQDRISLFEGRLNYRCVNCPPTASSLYVDLNLPVVTSESLKKTPESIVKAVERLSLYRLQQKAYQELSEGKVDLAAKHLQHLSNRLLSLGENDLSQAILEEVANLLKSTTISAHGKKRIKYGTRSLLLPSGKTNPVS